MKPANNSPVYACVYKDFAEIARTHGYALAVHGSMARDFDLICIPWIASAGSPTEVVRHITSRFALRCLDFDLGRGPTLKEHGRIAYTLVFKWGDVALDLSFMPRIVH